MKFLKDITVKGKKVLYRVDINVNIVDGEIADDTRIRAVIPTLEALQSAGAKQIILLAHQGRPKKGVEASAAERLDMHAKRLGELMKQEVMKFDSCRDLDIPEDRSLIMLENVRLDDESSEDADQREEFAQVLAQYGDVYVNDAFAACHRNHASISALPALVEEKAAGLLLEQEIKHLQPLLEGKIEHPFTVIIGGAKIDTKIGVIQQFLDTADHFLVGGGIANTFLYAEGFDVGESLHEPDKMDLAQDLALQLDKKNEGLVIPEDVICADDIGEDVQAIDVPVEDVMGDMKILDIGARTSGKFVEIIKQSKTIIWNGPMGLIEYSHFRYGSEAVAKALAEVDATVVIGGGESVAVINMLGIDHSKYSHVSTGGGAMLGYLSGEKLPGLIALE